MSNWYLLRNGQTYGPYPEEQVRQWVRAGQVAPDEKLNREGDPNWLSLDMIPEFAKDREAAPVQYAPFGAAGQPKDKTVAGILAILLGALGIHHFYLGNTTLAWIYLLMTVVSCGTLSPVVGILGLIDGIMYLTKPEDVFQRCYRNWFCSEGPSRPLA